MRLIELDASFLRVEDDNHYKMVENLSEADGVSFLCPQCCKTKGTNIGVHTMICWQPKVPQTISPKPGRWTFQGTGLSDLTLVAGSSSILIQGGCNAHFFIRNGEIEFMGT